MHHFVTLLVISSIFVASQAWENVEFKDCQSHFKIDKIEVDGASLRTIDLREFVILKSETEPKIRITYTPNESNLTDYETIVRARISDAMLMWNMPEPKTCKFTQCPSVKGQQAVYEQSIKINKEYPQGKVQINWIFNHPRAYSDKRRDVCVIFLARIEA